MSEIAYKLENNNNQQENEDKVLTLERLNGESPSSASQRKDCFGNNIDKDQKK